jgi:hypothetical protein
MEESHSVSDVVWDGVACHACGDLQLPPSYAVWGQGPMQASCALLSVGT